AAAQHAAIWLLFARPSLVEEVHFDIGGVSRPLTSYQGLNTPHQPLDGLSKAERTDALVQAAKKILQQLQKRAPVIPATG
ncbi:MAG TPA: hypothetical protein VFB81_18275, partial [Myxococcales bacterium]|nr:hypothetical protein [Myxococcales bacterium]